MKPLLYVSISLVLALFVGCKSTDTMQSKSKANASTDTSDKEELYWARVDSAKMQFAKADVMFMTKMIGHHAQALIMSRLAPENGASKQVQTLASRIINSQKDEIQTMQQWLSRRNQPTVDLRIHGLRLLINGKLSGHIDMVGMLSQQQLEDLSQANGSEFDRLFLRYMIGHHKGAVVMVENLFNKDGAALEDAAFKLASNINVDQKTEIARMQKMLDQLKSTSR